MNQIEFKDNILILRVKKSNIFSRSILYLITVLSAVLPLGGFFVNLINGGEFKFFNLIFLLLFGLIFFYMLRISLWNTYGKEVINISKNKLKYTADYNWFKDKIKEFDYENITFTLNKVGYEEDNKGVLVIDFNNGTVLETVTKIDTKTIHDCIYKLNKNYT
jgi:hypothetical protein